MRGVLVLLAAAVAVGLAGCGETVDTAKQTFPRSTVPAGEGGGNDTGSTGAPKTNDPAFSNDKLRSLDPCGLLTDDILASVGKPDENRFEDFGSCANYMEDKDGKDLSITLYVGEQINGAEDADDNIGGLPAFVNELDDSSACFVNVVTSTNPNFGVRVQVGGDGDDLCELGTTLLTGVIDLIREDPPEREDATGSIAGVDPCSLLEPEALKPVIGGVDTTVSPYTLHWCNWVGGNVEVGVWFRTGYNPKDSSEPGQPVDLGNGLTVYQTADTSYGATCRLEWSHRATGEEGEDEIIEVDFDNAEPPAGDNGCATAVEVVKVLVPALPKP